MKKIIFVFAIMVGCTSNQGAFMKGNSKLNPEAKIFKPAKEYKSKKSKQEENKEKSSKKLTKSRIEIDLGSKETETRCYEENETKIIRYENENIGQNLNVQASNLNSNNTLSECTFKIDSFINGKTPFLFSTMNNMNNMNNYNYNYNYNYESLNNYNEANSGNDLPVNNDHKYYKEKELNIYQSSNELIYGTTSLLEFNNSSNAFCGLTTAPNTLFSSINNAYSNNNITLLNNFDQNKYFIESKQLLTKYNLSEYSQIFYSIIPDISEFNYRDKNLYVLFTTRNLPSLIKNFIILFVTDNLPSPINDSLKAYDAGMLTIEEIIFKYVGYLPQVYVYTFLNKDHNKLSQELTKLSKEYELENIFPHLKKNKKKLESINININLLMKILKINNNSENNNIFLSDSEYHLWNTCDLDLSFKTFYHSIADLEKRTKVLICNFKDEKNLYLNSNFIDNIRSTVKFLFEKSELNYHTLQKNSEIILELYSNQKWNKLLKKHEISQNDLINILRDIKNDICDNFFKVILFSRISYTTTYYDSFKKTVFEDIIIELIKKCDIQNIKKITIILNELTIIYEAYLKYFKLIKIQLKYIATRKIIDKLINKLKTEYGTIKNKLNAKIPKNKLPKDHNKRDNHHNAKKRIIKKGKKFKN